MTKQQRTGACPHGVIGFCAPCDDPARLTAAAGIGGTQSMTGTSTTYTPQRPGADAAHQRVFSPDGSPGASHGAPLLTSNENSLPADGRTEEAALAELISIVRALRRDRDHFQACWNSVSEMRETNDRLCQENERLRAALERYGRHEHPNCHDLTLKEDGSFGPRNGCLCGLDSVLSGTSVVETKAHGLITSVRALGDANRELTTNTDVAIGYACAIDDVLEILRGPPSQIGWCGDTSGTPFGPSDPPDSERVGWADKDEPYAANLAQTMKIARAITGKGLREYATFLKINSATYCRIEQGKGCDVSTLIRINEATGISYDLLIKGAQGKSDGR